TILLILQLTLQKMYRLLVYFDEFSIDHDLIELRLHSRDELIQNIPKREIGAISLKKGAANFRESGAVKNQLRPKNANAVRDIARLSICNRWCRRGSSTWWLNISEHRTRRY